MRKRRRDSVDIRILGEEPENGMVLSSTDKMQKAYNYYNYHYNWRDIVDMYKDILKKTKQDELYTKIKQIPFHYVPNTVAVIGILQYKECILPPEYINHYKKEIKKLLNIDPSEIIENVPDDEQKTITRERKLHHYYVSMVENVLDEFYKNDYKTNFNAQKFYVSNEVPNYALEYISNFYNELLEELKNINKDPDLKEAYSNRSKESIKSEINLIQSIINEATSIINNKKRARKPRKRKEKSNEQLVSGVTYQVHSKELNISSLSPEKIIGSNEVYLYNSKYRRIIVLSSEKGLTIRGTTIYDWDEKTSYAKTIRKPEQTIPELANATKRGCKNILNNLTTKKDTSYISGRLSDQVLILKIF